MARAASAIEGKRARGPLAVELHGPCELYGLDGVALDLAGKTRVLLCRCGHSKQAPICDGSHYQTDFEKPAAPPDADDAHDAHDAHEAHDAPPT